VNVSGAAIARHAPNKDIAVRFLEFLVSDKGQELYAQANFEYPVKPGVAISPLIAELGALTPDKISLTDISANRKTASTLVDKVSFDQ
jgi:iron(III) transport system substrate-binding protein